MTSHRILCGDSRDPADVDRLFDGAKAAISFTSPPYADRRVYDESSGFKPILPDEYVDWFEAVQANVAAHLADDGSWFVNIKAHVEDGQRCLYVMDLVLAHVRRWGWRLVDEFCWNGGGMPGGWPNRFRNEWEPVFHFTRGEHKCRRENVQYASTQVIQTKGHNTVRLLTGERDRAYSEDSDAERGDGMANPGNVLRIKSGGDAGAGGHAAAFPSALPEWFIRAFSDPGDIIYDPFLGSGSTAVAAHRQGRSCYGMDCSPAYVDVAVRRLRAASGLTPVHATTGEPFPVDVPSAPCV